ncbi:hypothetical protein [Nocardioides sp.]|uniref:hypothetical protein n=1 Tax=Nocardioides sp. TaxID=35761 RepID=UPI0027352622|nr:hypothetical protein [Nocardioides sp.]MDP3889793.1 hypothetical protein [Nocardioides sp.]
MRLALALTVTFVLVTLAGCGDPQGVDPDPHPEVTDPDAAVRLVDEAEADLVLYLSNQSFDDEEVNLTVTIDGITVVDDGFHVEGQHNWVSFPLTMPTGDHTISAESDSGATLRETFEVRRGKKRYAAIEHWTEGGTAELTWQFQRRPMAFA